MLEIGNASDLGIVLAVRQGSSAAVLLLGGVLSDRLPRNRVLVGASLTQGLAQAAMAASVLSGSATVDAFVVLALLYGLATVGAQPSERSSLQP